MIPSGKYDFLLASHCLEHMGEPVMRLPRVAACAEEKGIWLWIRQQETWRHSKSGRARTSRIDAFITMCSTWL